MAGWREEGRVSKRSFRKERRLRFSSRGSKEVKRERRCYWFRKVRVS